MAIYQTITLTIKMGALNSVYEGIQKSFATGKYGEMQGCWFCDIGTLNQVMVLTKHADGNAAMAASKAINLEDAHLGCQDFITDFAIDHYQMFPCLPEDITTGEFGKYYEIRYYGIKLGAVQATIDAWEKAVPNRAKVSHLVGAMYSLDNRAPKFMNIWPYKTLDERNAARAKAVADGVWPPVGGPANLTHMQSGIWLPAPFSPLR
jgi:hypothetical protein